MITAIFWLGFFSAILGGLLFLGACIIYNNNNLTLKDFPWDNIPKRTATLMFLLWGLGLCLFFSGVFMMILR